MRLSDIMSHADLATFPEVALVLFLGIFAIVVVRLYLRRGSTSLQQYADMPLRDEAPSEVPGREKVSTQP